MRTLSNADSGGFRVSLLGGFSVSCGGRSLAVKPAEQRLIAFLAVRRRPTTRAKLAGVLWPDTTEVKAHGRLRTTIWRCHHEGGEGLVDASATATWLHPAVSVDVHDLVARIEDMSTRREQIVAPHELALDLLDGWYDDWVLVEQESFRQRRLHALDLCCELLRERGRYAEALGAGLAAVAAEPLRESAHSEVIKVHLAEGNLGEATRQLHLFDQLLMKEFGAHPSARLCELVRREPVTVP
jgi:DNA-binding SARP family transcriptional activator